MSTIESTTHEHPIDPTLPLGKPPIPYERFGFSWGAVVAGLVTAIALDVMFAQVALSMNLSIVDRASDAEAIAIGNAVFWVVTGLIALFAGAWVAGRMTSARTEVEGGLHGLAVWGAGAIVMTVVTVGAFGIVGGGMLALAGQAMDGVAKVAEIAAPNAQQIKDELATALEQGRVNGEATAGNLADRSRLTDFATRHFDVDAEPLAADERREVIQLMSTQLGISEADAEKTLTQWDAVWQRNVERYEAAKQEAARKAEQARQLARTAAAWAAVAMLLSAGAAMAGGALGTKSRIDRVMDEPLNLGHTRTTTRVVASGPVIGTPLRT